MSLRSIAIPGATFVLTTICLAGLYWTRGATPLERLAPRESDGWQAVAVFLLVAVLAVVVAGFLTQAVASLVLGVYVRRSRRLRRELVLACAAGLAPRLPVPRNAAQSVLFHASIDAYLHQHGAPALARFLERGSSFCRTSLACAFAILLACVASASVVQRALDLRVPVSVRWDVVASIVFAGALVLVITAALAFVEHFAALLAWLRERARREIGISAHPHAYVAASLPEDFATVRRGPMAYVWTLVALCLVGMWAWGLWSASSPVSWLVWMGALSAIAMGLATFTLAWRRWSDVTRFTPSAPTEPVLASAPAPAPESSRKPVRGEMEPIPEPPKPPVSPALAAMIASQPHLETPKKPDPFEALAKRTRGSEQWLEMPIEPPSDSVEAPQASAGDVPHLQALHDGVNGATTPAPHVNGAGEGAPARPLDERSYVLPAANAPAREPAPPPAPLDDAARRRRENVRAAVLRRLTQDTPQRQSPPNGQQAASSAASEPAAPREDDDVRPRASSSSSSGASADVGEDPFATPPQRTWLVSPHGLRASSAIAPGRIVQDEAALQSSSDDPFAWAAFGLHAPRVDTGISPARADASDGATSNGAPRVAASPAGSAPGSRPVEPVPELPQDDPRRRDGEAPPDEDGPPRDAQRDPTTLLF